MIKNSKKKFNLVIHIHVPNLQSLPIAKIEDEKKSPKINQPYFEIRIRLKSYWFVFTFNVYLDYDAYI